MASGIARMLGSARIELERLRRNDAGSVMTFMVVLPVLAGSLALGVETGSWYLTKQRMQVASDAAALAASVDKAAGKDTATITATARYETQRAGFIHGADGVTVSVNIPPLSGPYTTHDRAVEVIVQRQTTAGLAKALYASLGGSTFSFAMKARSTGALTTDPTTGSSAEGCVVALTTGNEQGIKVNNFSTLNIDCTVVSNGTATFSNTNASISLHNFTTATLNRVYSRGTFNASNFSALNLANRAITNASNPGEDPYVGLATPMTGTCSFNPYNVPNDNTLTLNPGTYCGGLSINNKTTVNFTPGTYYITNGDLILNGITTVACPTCTGGAGVTFVLTQTSGNNNDIGGVTLNNLGTVTLVAPNSGTYAGIVFYQDRRAPLGSMAANTRVFGVNNITNVTLAGAVYFPSNRIDINNLSAIGTAANRCLVWIGRYINANNFTAGTAACANYGTLPVRINTSTMTSVFRVIE